jgi:hypothetical protein
MGCLLAIPLDCAFGINTQITTSAYRYGLWIVLAWVFAIINHLGQPRPMRARASSWQLARGCIHRACFLLTIVCLLMIPVSLAIEANEWGSFPEGYQTAAFVYAWIFAAIHECSRQPKSTQACSRSELPDNPLDS